MRNVLDKILNWYFSKNALPYWCILMFDCIIVFLSGVLSFWIFNKTLALFSQRFDVLYTLLVYIVLSLVGAKLFRTYSGIVRYSSFDDLLKVAMANTVSMLLALAFSFGMEYLQIRELSALNQTSTVLLFVIGTLSGLLIDVLHITI